MKIPIACSLSVDEAPERIEEWRAALEPARMREANAAGFRLEFAPDAAIAGRLADLAARELACCAFFTFNLTLTNATLVLEVLAPAETHEMIGELFGPAIGA